VNETSMSGRNKGVQASDKEMKKRTWQLYLNKLIAREISKATRYYDAVIQIFPREGDSGFLLNNIDAPEKYFNRDRDVWPEVNAKEGSRSGILLNGTINHHHDIEGLLVGIKRKLGRYDRVILVAYNPYLSWLYRLASRLGLRRGEIPTTFVTRVDLDNIAKLAGLEVVRSRPVGYIPWKLFGLGDLINRVVVAVPLVNIFSFASVIYMRPIVRSQGLSLSCVVPARNERDNIEPAVKRMPDLDCALEVIFIEGHSSDGTWEEIERVAKMYGDKFKIRALKQTGKGKNDAVRLGFREAQGDLLTVLDADLTMPPELLSRFYQAYCEGHADFINGSRLVYPMEKGAMQSLNRLGNVFFAKALSWVLNVRIGDSLCGTKMLSRHDYKRAVCWRNDFGDFDPFGDFELLFPAAILGLGIVDVPIRYRERTYGSTNIHRFRHGWYLLRMTLYGFMRIRLG